MKTVPNGGPLGSFADKFRLLYAASCDSRLTKADMGVLAVLCWRYNAAHGCCWPSIGAIASDAGIDERTVQRRILHLEESGYLHVRRGKGALNKFVLHFGGGGVAAGGYPRPPGPQPPAAESVTPGVPVRQPPAQRPPESINGFLKEKEAFESNGEKPFSFFGGINEKASEGQLTPQPEKPKASPETKRETRLGILTTRREVFSLPEDEYDEQLAKIERQFESDKQAEAEG